MPNTLEHRVAIIEHMPDGSFTMTDYWVETFEGALSNQLSEQYVTELEVDWGEAFQTLANFNPSARVAQNLSKADIIWIKNTSSQPAEIQLQYASIGAGNPDTDAESQENICMILGGGRWVTLPGIHAVHYGSATSAANGDSTTVNNLAPAVTYQGSTDMDVNDAAGVHASNNPVEFGVTKSAWFVIGDMIRIDNEIMRVAEIDNSGANHLRCTRGHFGSTIAAHSDDAEIYFFNGNQRVSDWEFGVKTNFQGNYKSTSFFGYGRNGDANKDFWGVVPGSVTFRGYDVGGFQRFGVDGISPGENSGLAVSTLYGFKCAVDGGTADEIEFTTDSVNVNWGGKNGILDKINKVFKDNYRTNGKNMINKRVSIGIVAGDLQITSHSNLSTTAIAITATAGSGANMFDGNYGRIPAIASLPAGKKKALANQKRTSGIQTKSDTGPYHIHDDGNGNLYFGENFVGGPQYCGEIDYFTGEFHFSAWLIEAEFTVYATVQSGLSGPGGGTQILKKISGRSTSPIQNATIKVRAFDKYKFIGDDSTNL